VTQIVRLASAPAAEPFPGVRMQPLFGEAAMLNLIELDPGAVVPAHGHPHEQLGFVLEGVLLLTVGGVEHRLQPGDGYQIPGGTEHAARAEGPCRVLDVFHPVREDYRTLAAGA
jgi:quercetin dioxygenase-like cupin family protein